ncbi:MAG: hypothetical protein DWQ04_28340 [Chloroflexi bacterium]|nr:MAG: hypothetical protein DWQ04_28340 [Chloroflexota bacterium]
MARSYLFRNKWRNLRAISPFLVGTQEGEAIGEKAICFINRTPNCLAPTITNFFIELYERE